MRALRILIAGSSGFLGGALAGRLRADGHQVVRLVRRPATGPDELSWQPGAGASERSSEASDAVGFTGRLDPAAVAGADAVVNLAGTPLGMSLGPLQVPARPWTASYRERFRASRVGTNATLARAIAAADPRPPVFLAGSGVGWYGDTGDTEVDERAPAGDGFFPDTCREWEAATEPAEAAGVRVVHLRTGLPLHRDGGVVGPQLLAFRLGLGGRAGSGRQWLPWISLADWVAAAVFLLGRDDLAGPVNLVGPAPVTNAEFTKTLGQLLHRPTVLRLPAPLLRLALGEFASEVLDSKRVLPGVLAGAGFTFTHPDLRSALRAALT